MTNCRSCAAQIEFVRTVAGRTMPLDAAPTPEGNVRIIDGLAHVLGPLDTAVLTEAERAELRMPHHATCPDAGEWKRT